MVGKIWIFFCLKVGEKSCVFFVEIFKSLCVIAYRSECRKKALKSCADSEANGVFINRIYRKGSHKFKQIRASTQDYRKTKTQEKIFFLSHLAFSQFTIQNAFIWQFKNTSSYNKYNSWVPYQLLRC